MMALFHSRRNECTFTADNSRHTQRRGDSHRFLTNPHVVTSLQLVVFVSHHDFVLLNVQMRGNPICPELAYARSTDTRKDNALDTNTVTRTPGRRGEVVQQIYQPGTAKKKHSPRDNGFPSGLFTTAFYFADATWFNGKLFRAIIHLGRSDEEEVFDPVAVRVNSGRIYKSSVLW